MSKFLVVEQTGNVVTVTMNRPEERNALSYSDQYADFVEVFGRLNGDLSVRAVILTGAGPAFCAGGNIKQMRERVENPPEPPFLIRNFYRDGIQQIPLAVYNLEIPTIAAVNGPAIGAGCDLACMCDIRIASEKARFAESFVKLGIIPGDGGAWLLPRAVGMSKAAEMTFTGDAIGAAEALECGLVSKVVPPEQLMDEPRALANRIAANPVHALRMSKRLLREGQHTRLETLLEMSSIYQAAAHLADDHREALIASLERREPSFGDR